ncbi:MAG: alpha/beta hydrolase [Gammaproteobacteria bacterium]|nr:alpha/beta hydrolase [Gammaproteobacteria bacterium]
MKWRHLVFVALAGFWTAFGALAAELPGRFVELPTVRLWMIDSGGTGEPVILLHPRTGNSEYWQNTVPALAEAGYRAIAIDNPGWGKSVVHDAKNPLPVAVTIDALIDYLQLDKVHVVGTAMGGYVALDYAASRPERTSSLVIAASGLGLQGDPEYAAFRERAEIPLMDQQPSHIREMSPTYRGMNPEGVARWQEIYKNAQQDGAVRPPLTTPNTPEKLASLRVPTLVIAGGMDLVTPSGGMRLWSRHITAPKDFLVLAEAGHVLVWEQPDVFNQLLIGFLQEH